MFHIFAKKFHFGTPHLLDFQVAAWWLARLYACFRKVAPFALPVEVFALVRKVYSVFSTVFLLLLLLVVAVGCPAAGFG